MVARHVRDVEAGGSSPPSPTISHIVCTMHNLLPHRIAIVLSLIVVGILAGLWLTLQLRSPKSNRVSSPELSLASLETTQVELTEDQTQLKEQLATLHRDIEQTQRELKTIRANREKVETLERYRDQLGLTEVSGAGVVITLANGTTGDDATVFASDLRDVVNTLWEGGAEAISINGERVVWQTAIDALATTTLINGTKTTVPYVVTAIGNNRRLDTVLKGNPALQDLRRRQTQQGLVFDVRRVPKATAPAFTGSLTVQSAKTVEDVL